MVPTGEAWCENGGRRKPFYEQDPRNQNTIQQFLGMCRFEKTTNISCFQKKSTLLDTWKYINGGLPSRHWRYTIHQSVVSTHLDIYPRAMVISMLTHLHHYNIETYPASLGDTCR